MGQESRVFGLALFLIIVGLAILLYGVTLNNGQSLNTEMTVGGVGMLLGVSALTAGIFGLEEPSSE